MNRPDVFACLVLTCGSLAAQCAPPTSLASQTPFTATHTFGPANPPSPDPGFNTLWDMTVRAGVTISAIDCRFADNALGNYWFGLPIQVGNTAPVTLWLFPGTHVGNETSSTGWTQLGSGTVTVAAAGSHSVAVLTPPVFLSPGTNGFALQVAPTTAGPGPLGRLHPEAAVPAFAPLTPLSASDQFLDITNQANQGVAFVSGPFSNLAVNIEIHYAPTAGSAYWTSYGSGCYFRPEAFYEVFGPPPAVFDLAGLGLTMLPNGPPGAPTHYSVLPSGSSIVPPTTPALPLGDDDVLVCPLPFTFAAPGGVSTNSIGVGSNGSVVLNSIPDAPYGFWNEVARYLNDDPSLAVCYGDWDPSPAGSGTVHFDVDPSNQSARITWNNVQEYAQPTAHVNAQIEIFASGQVDYRIGATNIVLAPILVGFSPGNGKGDPGGRDLAVGGVIAAFSSGDGQTPPVLGVIGRPLQGFQLRLVTTNLQPGTLGCLLALSLGSSPSVPLDPFGLPGCSANIAVPVLASLFWPVAAGPAIPLGTLPNTAAWTGYHFYAQSAPFTPGLNAANLLTSNAVCIHPGLF